MESYQSYFDKYNVIKPNEKKFYQRLRNAPKGELQNAFEEAHEEIFDEIDCLECAGCCKTISPIFTQRDIERLAKSFKQKPGQFISENLIQDEDGDYVVDGAPCKFLGTDNYCTIYNERPNACREYPHTNMKKMHSKLELTKQNIAYCPAVAGILTKLNEIF